MSNFFNHTLLSAATESLRRQQVLDKVGFVDPSGAGAGGGGAPPGGAPPADPAAGMAAPPPPEGGGSMGPDQVKAMIEQVMMQQQAAGGGAAGGAMGKPAKPKIDVNTEIYQIKKLLVLMAKTMDIPIPADLLLGDPAMDPAIPPSEAAKDPLSAAATQSGGGLSSAISPITPMQGASPALASAGAAGAGGGGAGGGGAKSAQWGSEFQPRSLTTERAQDDFGQKRAADIMANVHAARGLLTSSYAA